MTDDTTSADAGMQAAATRCGVVAIIGAPNAGKSTLTNALVGAKVAIVSPKVQTTRTRLMGIAIEGPAQLMLVDTPGIFAPRRRLDRAMVKAAWQGASDADVIVVVVDAKRGLREEVRALIESLAQRPEPKLLVLNKVDLCAKEKLLPLTVQIHALQAFEDTFMVSAESGDGVARFRTALAERMPASPWHFPEDQLSDISQRLLASEITREQLYLQLHEELPYAATVETEKWEDRKDGSAALHQVVYVERDTQKAIVLGKGGSRIKQLGGTARLELEKLLGRRIHLFLFVKVKPDWADDREIYRDMGLEWTD